MLSPTRPATRSSQTDHHALIGLDFPSTSSPRTARVDTEPVSQGADVNRGAVLASARAAFLPAICCSALELKMASSTRAISAGRRSASHCTRASSIFSACAGAHSTRDYLYLCGAPCSAYVCPGKEGGGLPEFPCTYASVRYVFDGVCIGMGQSESTTIYECLHCCNVNFSCT